MARDRRLSALRVRWLSAVSSSVSFVLSAYFLCVSSSSCEMSSYMALYVSCTVLAVLAALAFRLTAHVMTAPMPPDGIAHCSICMMVSLVVIVWVLFPWVVIVGFLCFGATAARRTRGRPLLGLARCVLRCGWLGNVRGSPSRML